MLVLLDRTVDPATPMCTQLTYEGIIDETLHINNGVVQIDGQQGQCLRQRLNSQRCECGWKAHLANSIHSWGACAAMCCVAHNKDPHIAYSVSRCMTLTQ